MGTRNITKVISNGETKIAQYCQWDGYPDGKGRDLYDIVKDKELMDNLRNNINDVRFITSEELKKKDPLFEKSMIDMNESKYLETKYPQFHRNNGGPEAIRLVAGGTVNELIDDSDFQNDGLFCEYAYEINLDDNTLTAYTNFTTSDNRGDKVYERGTYNVIDRSTFDDLPPTSDEYAKMLGEKENKMYGDV